MQINPVGSEFLQKAYRCKCYGEYGVGKMGR